MISMKNSKIIASWDKIEPSDSANERMLSAIMEQNRSVHDRKDKVYSMPKNNSSSFRRIPRVAVIALVLCICLTGASALAASGVLQGFFKDIFGWNGAVVGTAYEDASDEMEISAEYDDSMLTVTVKMANTDVAPYREIETLRIKSYSVVDDSGKTIIDNQNSDAVAITDGSAVIKVPISLPSAGNYKLIISEFEGGKKADQPLSVTGNWQSEFVA